MRLVLKKVKYFIGEICLAVFLTEMALEQIYSFIVRGDYFDT